MATDERVVDADTLKTDERHRCRQTRERGRWQEEAKVVADPTSSCRPHR